MENEDQQVEQVKSFIKEYGPWIVGGLVVGLGLMFAWRSFQSAQLAEQQAATAQVKQIVDQLDAETSEVIEAQSVLGELSDSDYAALTRLVVAKSAVAAENLEEAATQLEMAMNESTNAQVTSIAALRLARVEIALGRYDNASNALSQVTVTSYAALKSEIEGDLHLAQGNEDAARMAYASALESSESGMNRVLQMKLDSLAVNP
ncbi:MULTISPECIES: tetratricopeptide repeat protein [Gammaproteobacteria]|uniref:YfgM family protein n=1 Tax=Gammaproteobacteria TaxID=1236 RepID=UPI001403EADA|nr:MULTISPECIES: tetratricopeptide repeat protein [Gammaproteobacteria]